VAKDKNQRAGDDGPDVPEWIVTFSDMISLLVTFFVLLMTFSSLEEDDVIKVKGAMTGTPGVILDDLSRDMVKAPLDLMAKTDPIRGLQERHSRPPEELPDDVADFGEKQQEDQVEVDLKKLGDGLRLTFGDPCYFKPGSAEVPAVLEERARDLAEILSHYPYAVAIEGFTDDAFRPTLRYPDAETLSVARAVAVADLMLDGTGLEPMKVQFSGHGPERPVGDNATPEGRQRNRRVEVRVLSLETSRATWLESERRRVAEDKRKAAAAKYAQENR